MYLRNKEQLFFIPYGFFGTKGVEFFPISIEEWTLLSEHQLSDMLDFFNRYRRLALNPVYVRQKIGQFSWFFLINYIARFCAFQHM